MRTISKKIPPIRSRPAVNPPPLPPGFTASTSAFVSGSALRGVKVERPGIRPTAGS
jgi:hypothetical protein